MRRRLWGALAAWLWPTAALAQVAGAGYINPLSMCQGFTYTYNEGTPTASTNTCSTNDPSGSCNAPAQGLAAANSATTNDTAWQQLNKEWQLHTRPADAGGFVGGYQTVAGGALTGTPYPFASKDNCIVINIGAGTFQYTWNQLQLYVRHLTVNGVGSGLSTTSPTVLQNTNTTNNYYTDVEVQKAVDYFGDPTATLNYGYPINSISAGSTQVVLQTPANASNFFPGRWVLVMDFTQRWYGYGPDFRYYDWAKVLSVNATTGLVNLDTPLKFAHYSNSTFDANSQFCTGGTPGVTPGCPLGPANLVAIDTPSKPVMEWLSINGVQLPGNQAATSAWTSQGCFQTILGVANTNTCDAWQIVGIIDGQVNDLNDAFPHTRLEVYQIRNLIVQNSHWYYDEADKDIGNLRWYQDNVGRSDNHAGQLYWQMHGGSLGQVSISALNALIDGGTIINGMTFSTGCAFGQCNGIILDDDDQTVGLTVNGAEFVGVGAGGLLPISGPSAVTNTGSNGGDAVSIDNANMVFECNGTNCANGPNGANTRIQTPNCLFYPNQTATFANGLANITMASTGLNLSCPVQFTTTGALPTNFATGTTYYVVSHSGTINTVSATVGGAAISAGSPGTGTQTAVWQAGHPSQGIINHWAVGSSVMVGGSWVSGATITNMSTDSSNVYVDVSGTTFATNNVVFGSRVGSVTVKNAVGVNTTKTWTSQNLSNSGNIPTITWTNNSGN
jgi:hypothetical protein